MKPKFYLTLLLLLIAQFLKAQNVIYEATPLGWPKLTVHLEITAANYKTSDSIKVQVTIINKMNYAQKIAYKKGSKYAPLETWFDVTNARGKAAVEVANKHVLSSYMYSQKELEKKGMFISISPLQAFTQTYYLKDVVVFSYKDYNTLSPGTYSLVVSYYGNLSNKVSFKIMK